MNIQHSFNIIRRSLGLLTDISSTTLEVTLRRFTSGPKLSNWNWSFEVIVEFLQRRFSQAGRIEEEHSISQSRNHLNIPVPPLPVMSKVKIEESCCPVPSRWIYPVESSRNQALTALYLHGGGFVYNPDAHDLLLSHLVHNLQLPMLIPDYRLAPEHPFPAALEDSIQSYRWLREEKDLESSDVIVMGDSAGGNLVLELLLSLRDQNEEQPELGVCLSPWADLLNRGKSLRNNVEYDYLNIKHGDRWAHQYANGKARDHPSISPVEADLSGLTSLYIQAGGAEAIIDMVRTFSEKAERQGVDITLDVWEEMVHVFQSFADFQPEAREAIDEIRKMVETCSES